MKLYHYTGSEHVSGIQHEGIRLGGVPLLRDDGSLAATVPGFVWLTTDAHWRQGWATRVAIHCDRTEFRFVVRIPKSASGRLVRWEDAAASFGYAGEKRRLFESFGNPASWWLFAGRIPPGWLRGLEQRPAIYAVVEPPSLAGAGDARGSG